MRKGAPRKSPDGFTLIELMIVVAIIGILALIALPQFSKYLRQAKTAEALEALSKITDGAAAYYQTEHYDSCGSLASKAFPSMQLITAGVCGFTDLGASSWVPSDKTCSQYSGNKCPGAAGSPIVSEFENQALAGGVPGVEIWRILKFGISSPHFFNYKFTAAGSSSGATFRAIACGDLNSNYTAGAPDATCDDVKLSKFMRTGLANGDNDPRINGIQIDRETE